MTAEGTDPLSQQSNVGRDVKSLSKKLKLFKAPHTQTWGEPPPRQLWQYRHRQWRQRKQQQKNQYDAAAASCTQKLCRFSRTPTTKEVTEAELTSCKITEDKLFDHFSCIFQQGERTDLTITTEVPLYVGSHTDDQNPFTGEFTPEEVWTRLHRCSNTVLGLDGISYAQWEKNDRGGYALNALVHRLGYIPQCKYWLQPHTSNPIWQEL